MNLTKRELKVRPPSRGRGDGPDGESHEERIERVPLSTMIDISNRTKATAVMESHEERIESAQDGQGQGGDLQEESHEERIERLTRKPVS